jgi:hypothetical protein
MACAVGETMGQSRNSLALISLWGIIGYQREESLINMIGFRAHDDRRRRWCSLYPKRSRSS